MLRPMISNRPTALRARRISPTRPALLVGPSRLLRRDEVRDPQIDRPRDQSPECGLLVAITAGALVTMTTFLSDPTMHPATCSGLVATRNEPGAAQHSRIERSIPVPDRGCSPRRVTARYHTTNLPPGEANCERNVFQPMLRCLASPIFRSAALNQKIQRARRSVEASSPIGTWMTCALNVAMSDFEVGT